MSSEEPSQSPNCNNSEHDEHAEIVQLALEEVRKCRERGERPNLAAICRETKAPYEKARRRLLQQDARQLKGGGTYKQAYLRMKKQLESQTRALESQSWPRQFHHHGPPRIPSPPMGSKKVGGYNKAMSDAQEQAVLEGIQRTGIRDISEVTQELVVRIANDVFARGHTDPTTEPRRVSVSWPPRFIKRHMKTLRAICAGTAPINAFLPSAAPVSADPTSVSSSVSVAPAKAAPAKARPVSAGPVTLVEDETESESETAPPLNQRQRTYVHCPFRVYAQLTEDVNLNDCAGHFLEGRRLKEHLETYHISRLPCPGCGADTSQMDSWMEIGAFARKHYDFGCRTPPNWPGYPDLSLEQICEIPERISIDVTIAFRSVWRGTFRGIPMPDPARYICPGRWDCIGFDHEAPRQEAATSLYPPGRREAHMQSLSRPQEKLPDMELWSETSDEEEVTQITRPRSSAATSSIHRPYNDSDSGIQLKPSPTQDPKSLTEDALLERLAGDVDELQRRLGFNMARRVLNGFLAPDLLAIEPSAPVTNLEQPAGNPEQPTGMPERPTRELEQPMEILEQPKATEPTQGKTPQLLQPKREASPVVIANDDIDMDDDWSEASSPVDGYMKGFEDEALPSAPWMAWTKKTGKA